MSDHDNPIDSEEKRAMEKELSDRRSEEEDRRKDPVAEPPGGVGAANGTAPEATRP